MTVRLRMFAAAREAAGRASDTFTESEAPDIATLLDVAAARYGDGFVAVCTRARVWLNGDEPERGLATTLVDNDEVAVLPPISGG